jgi:hypothetical protein
VAKHRIVEEHMLVIQCSECNTLNRAGRFCRTCGASFGRARDGHESWEDPELERATQEISALLRRLLLEYGMEACSECDGLNHPVDRFCGHCDVPRTKPDTYQRSLQRRHPCS